MNLKTKPLYRTKNGNAYVGDSLALMKELGDASVDLVVTSPPFALQRKKTYGNVEEQEYVDWIKPFGKEVFRILKDTGSFVLDLGGAYRSKVPSRSLYNFRVMLALCDDVGFNLAEDFYWFNPSKLPSPIEWVNRRKMRAKDSVNPVWWFGKTDFPKADVRKVLAPYSDRMKKLIQNPEAFYTPKKRPSGHDISSNFGKDNGGAIPSNLLSIPNTESNSSYMRACKALGIECHPARFPVDLPAFFIKMLTDENDCVLDIFAGSNTTGRIAESLNRKWIAMEINQAYLSSSVFRFLETDDIEKAKSTLEMLNTTSANLLLSGNGKSFAAITQDFSTKKRGKVDQNVLCPIR